MDQNLKMKANLLDKLIEMIQAGGFDKKEEPQMPEGEVSLEGLTEEMPEEKEMDI